MGRRNREHERAKDFVITRLRAAAPPELELTYRTEVKVPSHIYTRQGPTSLYRLDVGCFKKGKLLGGIEICDTAPVDVAKWVFLRTFGYDVIEIPATITTWPTDALDVTGSTVPGGPGRRTVAPYLEFYRYDYHPLLKGYPPLESVAEWESRTAWKVLEQYDIAIGKAMADNYDYYRGIYG